MSAANRRRRWLFIWIEGRRRRQQLLLHDVFANEDGAAFVDEVESTRFINEAP